MPQIVAIHSFRRGTGRSHTVANLTTLLAAGGQRVALLDANPGIPGIETLLGLPDLPPAPPLAEYLQERVPADQVGQNVTNQLSLPGTGQIFLLNSGGPHGHDAHALVRDFEASALREGLARLIRELQLDTLLIETPPGLNEETLLLLALCDTLGIILRLDHQDYQGTAVTVEVARRLEVPRYFLVVNHAPATFDPSYVKERVERTYDCEVAAILPYSEEMGTLLAAGTFAIRFPHHPLTAALQRVAARIRS